MWQCVSVAMVFKPLDDVTLCFKRRGIPKLMCDAILSFQIVYAEPLPQPYVMMLWVGDESTPLQVKLLLNTYC
ncbi:MAG: hypothetical protein ACEQSA_06370, partial [Weeksellaceae bacterium]